MANIDTLIEDMQHVLDEDTDHVVSEENLNWAASAFRQILATRFAARKEEPTKALRFSSIGKKDRQVWYAAHPPEGVEKMGPSQMFKFLYGDLIEIALLFIAKEAGHEVTHEQFEVTEDDVVGHLDAVIDGVPVDAKSASPYSFAKFMDGSFVFDDPFGYVPQLSGYSHKHGNTSRAAFLVADKVSGAIGLAPLSQEDILANPPGPRIKHLKEVLSKDTPPPRCYPDVEEGKSGNRKLAIGCSYCKFKDACWADANKGQGLRKFWYARGPVWLTTVKKEPLVAEA